MRRVLAVALTLLVFGCSRGGQDGAQAGPGSSPADRQVAEAAGTAGPDCPAIAARERAIRAECDSGVLSACRQIKDFVAQRALAGCPAPDPDEADEDAPAGDAAATGASNARQEECARLTGLQEQLQAQCRSGVLSACRQVQVALREQIMAGCGSSGSGEHQRHRECVRLAKSSLLAAQYCMDGKGDQEACAMLRKMAREAVQKGCSPDVVHEARAELGWPPVDSRTKAEPEVQPEAEPEVGPEPEPEAPAEQATVRQMVPPRYPPAAVRAGAQGQVVLRVEVDAYGQAAGVAIERSSGNHDLDRAALEAGRRWTFNPARSASGQPMRSMILVPVDFSLDIDGSAAAGADR